MSEAAENGSGLVLRDRFGRVARDLRVSLTDRCNLRCSYCMPAEGLEWLPTDETLSDDEVLRLCTIAVRDLGIEKIRFTGGEPLLRKSLEQIIEGCSQLKTGMGEKPEIALTTNALGLDRRAQKLADAGVDRVNISLDTMNPEHFYAITHRNRLHDVLKGIDAACSVGMKPVKVNAVLLRGINDMDAVDLLDFALQRGIQLRFIEQMPIGPKDSWQRQRLVTQADILALLAQRYTLEAIVEPDSHAPARLWMVDGNPKQQVGIIASVSQPFCHACDRTRITADGQLRSCLFSTRETDLRTPLRSGCSDREIAEIWAQGMWEKPRAHGLEGSDFAIASRTMSRIGG